MRALIIPHLNYPALYRLFKSTSVLLSLDLVDFFPEALGGLGFVSNHSDDDASMVMIGARVRCHHLHTIYHRNHWLLSNHNDDDGYGGFGLLSS